LATGTIFSSEKPIKNIPRRYNVSIARAVTPQASEHLSHSIPPIDMTTRWTRLAGVKRSHCPEGNIPVLTGHLQPFQPSPNIPPADRAPNVFTSGLAQKAPYFSSGMNAPPDLTEIT
jgi:hypothetical protein